MRRLERKFEGPAILGQLLEESGCELTVDEVQEEFVCALEEGSGAHEIIPLLWELEPRFESPAAARRTFSNLFGLWDLLAEGGYAPEPELPEQAPDAPLTDAFVEQAWRKLEDLPPREWQRARDRYENVHGDVPAWLFEQLAELDPVTVETALDLAFEQVSIAEQARPRTSISREALERAQPEVGDDPEPALATLVSTTLWEQAADEERPLPEEEIPAAEAALSTLRRVLGD